jgi:hypothetical protein
MGFMDKVKAQASTLAEKAQEGAKAGQGKLSSMQSKRQSDSLLLELGGIVYLERQGRATAGADARANELVSRLQAHEAEHGQIQVSSADAQPGDTGSFIPGASGSDAAAGGGIPTSGGMPTSSSMPTAEAPPPPPSPEAATTIPGGGGIPTGVPMSGGIPQSTTGLPPASYSADEGQEQA